MRIQMLAVVALAFVACADEYHSTTMQLQLQPPRGSALVEERDGPPRLARFSNGLEIYSVQKQPMTIDSGRLDQLLEQAAEGAGVGVAGDIVTSRSGDRQTGPAAQWVLRERDTRTIVYYLMGNGRYVLVVQRCPEAQFADAAIQLELAVGSIRLLE